MRISVLGLRGIPGVAGGIETHCEQLYGHLARQSEANEIFVLGRRTYMPPGRARFGCVTVIPLPHAKSTKLETVSNSVLGVLHSRFILNADLLHIHGICSAIVTPLAKLLGMKVVVTHHGRDYIRRKWNGFERLLLKSGEWCGARFADHVIAVSPTIARHLAQRYPGVRVSFIPNGADHLQRVPATAPRSRALLERFGLRQDGFIVSVGRLDPDKGFDEIIDAFSRSRCGGKLAIVGDDPRGSRYAKTLRARASDRVIFTGFLALPDVAALLSCASLFVLASHQEGFPISVLEAALIGTPLVLSDIPATRDLDFEPRHYFPVGDVATLAAMMDMPHAHHALADQNRLVRFQWASIAESTAATYHRVAGTSTDGAAAPAE